MMRADRGRRLTGFLTSCALYLAAVAAPVRAAAAPSQVDTVAPQVGTGPNARSSSAEAGVQAIAGRVVSAADGHPIANATLTLTVQRTNTRRSAPPGEGGPPLVAGRFDERERPGVARSLAFRADTAQTDAEGRFRFAPRPAARYSLRASAPGYLASLYLEHDGFSSAVVIGAGVPADDLRFALVPEASLHGRVLDDTGEPVRAAMLLYRDAAADRYEGDVPEGTAPRIRPAGGTQADDDGRFEFTNLRPGRYFVAATATPWYAVRPQIQTSEDRLPYRSAIDPALDVAYPITFYPHSTTEAGALPIALKAGGRAVANFLMQPEHAVTLTVQLPPADTNARDGMRPFPSLYRTLFGTEQSAGGQPFGLVNQQSPGGGQTLVIAGVAPGQYTMRTYGRPGQNQGDGTTVNLSAGSATVTVPPEVSAQGDVTIAVHAFGDATVPETLQVELTRFGPARFGRESAPVPLQHGSVHFGPLDPGQYRIRLLGAPEWRVERLALHGKVVPSQLLRVERGTTEAEIVATNYSPELRGAVHAGNGKLHAGALVVLVPAGTGMGEELFRADQSDLDGGFQFTDVLPGNYLLVALDRGWQLNWHSAAALMPYLSHAVPVTVPSIGPRSIALPEPAIAQQLER